MRKRCRTTKECVTAAAEALSDLNTFYVVISTMEGGHLHAPSYAGGERIIRICRSEADKRLREYDTAVAEILARVPTNAGISGGAIVRAVRDLSRGGDGDSGDRIDARGRDVVARKRPARRRARSP